MTDGYGISAGELCLAKLLAYATTLAPPLAHARCPSPRPCACAVAIWAMGFISLSSLRMWVCRYVCLRGDPADLHRMNRWQGPVF